MSADKILTRAAEVIAPIAGKSVRLSVSGTSARFAIPEEWRNRWLTVVAEGGDVDLLFGDDQVDVEYDKTSSVSNGEITANDVTGQRFLDGVERGFVCPGDSSITHFAAEASTACNLSITVSSNRTPTTG